MSLLIKDATVITVDADRAIHDPGAVFVEDGRIADVGPSADVAARHMGADRVVDGRGKVVAPGFVCTHTHVGYTIFRGRSEDAGLGCVTGMYFPMATVISAEERLAVGALTYAELLRSGVTTALVMEEEVGVYAPFVERLGIRSPMGVMIHDVDVAAMARGEYRFDPALGEAQMARATDFCERWHGAAEGRISAVLAPNMTIGSSPDQLRAVRAAADRLGRRISIHLGWGPGENEVTQRLYGKRPFAHARDSGMLAPDVIAAHCYYADEADIDILADSGASVAHCPLMNAVRGHIAPVAGYRARGVEVGLAIDNMFGDYFEVLRACVTVARIRAHDPMVMLTPEALELATIGAARALGMADEIGSLEPGKRADLMMLDFRAFGLTPTLDPVQNLVYHAHARDVEMVLVDGRVVVDRGALTTVDAEELVDGAAAAAASAWGRFTDKYGATSAA